MLYSTVCAIKTINAILNNHSNKVLSDKISKNVVKIIGKEQKNMKKEDGIYLTSKEVEEILRIKPYTLSRMRTSGKIPCIRLGKKSILYRKEDIQALLDGKNLRGHPLEEVKEERKRKHVIYCRTTGSGERYNEDLRKQKQSLILYCNHHGIIPDEILLEVSSSIVNEKREFFCQLLSMISDDEVETIYITEEDRLLRSKDGLEILQWICKKHHTNIVSLKNPVDELLREEEIIEDIDRFMKSAMEKLNDEARKKISKTRRVLNEATKKDEPKQIKGKVQPQRDEFDAISIFGEESEEIEESEMDDEMEASQEHEETVGTENVEDIECDENTIENHEIVDDLELFFQKMKK